LEPASAAAVLRARFVTFHLICLGWVFFRAGSIERAFDVLDRLVTGWAQPSTLVTPLVVAAIAGILVLQNLPGAAAPVMQRTFSRLAPVMQGAALAVVLFAITTLGPNGVAPFIYFRF
jgi:hypothetical protein